MVGLEDRQGAAAMTVQQGFVQHFILPFWETVARIIPELQHFADNASANASRLRQNIELLSQTSAVSNSSKNKGKLR